MTFWILPSNEETFRLSDCLKANKLIDWKQHNRFEVGDIVFIYNSIPFHRITHKMLVERVNVPSSEYLNDSVYWKNVKECEEGLKKNRYVRLRLIASAPDSARLSLDQLRVNGLKANLQSAVKVKDSTLLSYINTEIQRENIVDNCFDSIQDPNNLITEGAKTIVSVNRYERSNEAHKICVDVKGYSCAVCGMNFEDVYGSLGKDFIHVHHIVPISEIGQSYEIDPINDLVPVCPNCHAMLHRGIDGKVLTVVQLKAIVQKVKENKIVPMSH